MNLVAYSCCEDKSQEAYEHLFQSLVDYAAGKNTVLNPSSILLDSGKVAINAINSVFLQTLVNGCHFHCSQNVWQKV